MKHCVRKGDSRMAEKPHIFWIYTENFVATLDAATWLETTREIRNMGWQVTLVGVGDEPEQTIGGVAVQHVAKPDVYLLRQVIFHARVLRMLYAQLGSVDYVLFHQMSAPWVLLFRILLLLLFVRKRPKFVMDTRTVPMERSDTRDIKSRLRIKFYHLMNRSAHYWVDGQLAITQRIAESLGIPAQQLWGVWPSGVTLAPFASASEQREWTTPIELIYVGALHYERNVHVLTRAVLLAHAMGLPFRFTLVGDGSARADLQRIAAKSNGVIRYVEPVPHERIPEFLGRAHIGVLPFPDEEKYRVSSPIKLFEYMAAGMPILATRIVCHTDVVGDATYAFWAEESTVNAFVSALRQIHEQHEQLPELGKAAAAAATNWTWQASARKIIAGLERGTQSERGVDMMRILAITTVNKNSPSPCIQDQLDELKRRGIMVDTLVINQNRKSDYFKMMGHVFWESLRGHKYDLIHAFYGHCGLVGRAQFRAPVVTTFQGSDLLGGKNGAMHKKDGMIGDVAARLSNSVIVMSEEMKIASRREDTAVIPFGVNTDIFKPQPRSEAREALKLSPDTSYVLFPWHPSRAEKNFHIVEAALSLVREHIPHVQVVTLFAKSREEVALYMNACDAMVLVSDHEGSPMAVREAMACNLPIVSVDVGDVADVIAGVRNCVICERNPQAVAENLLTVLQSGERSNGNEKIATMNVSWAADRVLDVYQATLGEQSAAWQTVKNSSPGA
ncbi:MAG: hypothetical protein CUN54_05490 [Phototrophicales bacterium]|nr:MAG: hypothetical protein CUN54_05490 [Phototrophicales bacterium]